MNELLNDGELETWAFDIERSEEPITVFAARRLIATAIDARVKITELRLELKVIQDRAKARGSVSADFIRGVLN